MTKPLGTRLATNGPIWMRDNGDNWKKMAPHLTAQDIQEANDTAVKSMCMLNKIGEFKIISMIFQLQFPSLFRSRIDAQI